MAGLKNSRLPLAAATAATIGAGVYLSLSSAVTSKNDFAKPSDVTGKEYDFVIVGGGTAALVLANRLTERTDFTVLVLEAGGSGMGVIASRIPAAFYELQRNAKTDWNYRTVPQEGCNGREMHWTRTRLLGGCSSGNAMMHHRGAPEDFDEWAALQRGKNGEGEAEWRFSEFQKYFTKFETFVPHPENPIPTEERGNSGPVKTGYFSHFTKFGEAYLQTCESLGIPQVPDVNTSAGTMGVTRTMTYIDPAGKRVSTESAYLRKDVRIRPNLTVVTGAHVGEIRIKGSRAVGVEFTEKPGGPIYFAKARKEVLLSAGAVNTPKILMLSGLGPLDELAKHKIPLVKDLQGVGRNLADHLVMYMRYPAKPGLSHARYLRPQNMYQRVQMAGAIAQYLTKGTGPLTTNVQDCMAFARLGDGQLTQGKKLEGADDSSSGEGAPDIEIMCSGIAWADHGHGNYPIQDAMTFTSALLRPTSKGTITLSSSNPWDHPVVDPRYLTTEHDVEILTRSVKFSNKLARTEPMASLIDQNITGEPFDFNLGDASDKTIAATIRERTETLYHPCCTARMAPLEDGGVVDTRLRVHGIEGLRVIDASVFPSIVSGHTAAATIALAEKAADMIKGAYPEKH